MIACNSFILNKFQFYFDSVFISSICTDSLIEVHVCTFWLFFSLVPFVLNFVCIQGKFMESGMCLCVCTKNLSKWAHRQNYSKPKIERKKSGENERKYSKHVGYSSFQLVHASKNKCNWNAPNWTPSTRAPFNWVFGLIKYTFTWLIIVCKTQMIFSRHALHSRLETFNRTVCLPMRCGVVRLAHISLISHPKY